MATDARTLWFYQLAAPQLCLAEFGLRLDDYWYSTPTSARNIARERKAVEKRTDQTLTGNVPAAFDAKLLR